MASRTASRYLARMNAPAAVPPKQRKPDWIRVKAPVSEGYHATRRLMRDLNLATVCEEAACPNIGECWTKKHATVMILGDTCTRACAFCNVKTGMPRAVDPLEPDRQIQGERVAGAGTVAIRCDDEHFMAGLAQPLRQNADAGGVDAVIVADKYAHVLPRGTPHDTGSG